MTITKDAKLRKDSNSSESTITSMSSKLPVYDENEKGYINYAYNSSKWETVLNGKQDIANTPDKEANLTCAKSISNTKAIRKALLDAKTFSNSPPITPLFGFPRQTYVLLLIEFCERFCFYGIRSVLNPYFTSAFIGLDNNKANIYYHSYVLFAYLTPVVGGVIADQYWGKYKTISILSLVYILGNTIISMSSIIPILNCDATSDTYSDCVEGYKSGTFYGSMLGLAVIAIGTGGIKPCISAICGDQFPANAVSKRTKFFAAFYMIINIGSIISSYYTPIWAKGNMHNDAYWISFGVPSIFMVVALIIFFLGTKTYKINPPTGSVAVDFVKVSCGKKTTKKFKSEVNRVWKITMLIWPVLFFWSIFDLAGSALTIQVSQLDRTVNLGWIGKTFVPYASVETLNPVILICLTPVFISVIYPFVGKFVQVTPSRKMVLGFIFILVQMIWCYKMQMDLDMHSTLITPSYQCKYNKEMDFAQYNTFAFSIQEKKDSNHSIEAMNFVNYDEDDQIPDAEKLAVKSYLPGGELWGKSSVRYYSIPDLKLKGIANPDLIQEALADETTLRPTLIVKNEKKTKEFVMDPGYLNKVILLGETTDRWIQVKLPSHRDEEGKSILHIFSTNTKLEERVSTNEFVSCTNEFYNNELEVFKATTAEYKSFIPEINNKTANGGSLVQPNKAKKKIIPPYFSTSVDDIYILTFVIPQYSDCTIGSHELPIGVQATYSGVDFDSTIEQDLIQVPNVSTDIRGTENFHVWLYVITYGLSTIGEILISITGLDYCYTEAPQSMKVVVSSIWLLMVAFGNICPIFMNKASVLPWLNTHDSKKFYLNIMISAITIPAFMLMAYLYKPSEIPSDDDSNSITKIDNSSELKEDTWKDDKKIIPTIGRPTT